MDHEPLNKIFEYIDEHIYTKIYLTDLAQIAGYSPFYFSRLFSEAVGMPVTAYIRVRKMQYALVSLLEGKKVLEVSMLYAFDSHEGFTRAFYQLFGSTPRTVKKYLSTYKVPEPIVLDSYLRKESNFMIQQSNLQESMHQLIFKVVEQSFEEARLGFCSKIEITFLPDNFVKIQDNGRGIPLSQDTHVNENVLNKILAGHPITHLEYSQMGDFLDIDLQTVNSLCERLQVTVYRENKKFRQDFVRGIAQHELLSEDYVHEAGMELILKPDKEIFGQTLCSREVIGNWIDEKINEFKQLKCIIN